MKYYIAHSFKHREAQKDIIDAIVDTITSRGHEAFIFTRAYPNFEPGGEAEMMSLAMKEMSTSDVMIAELSTKEIGIGLEVGYMRGQNKPVIYLRKKGSEYSTTVGGVSSAIGEYNNALELQQWLAEKLPAIL